MRLENGFFKTRSPTETEHSNHPSIYYVYVLYNHKANEPYVGYTNDLRRRVKEHHLRMPELLYYEAYKDMRDAKERERKLKQRGQSVRWLKHRLKHSLEE